MDPRCDLDWLSVCHATWGKSIPRLGLRTLPDALRVSHTLCISWSPGIYPWRGRFPSLFLANGGKKKNWLLELHFLCIYLHFFINFCLAIYSHYVTIFLFCLLTIVFVLSFFNGTCYAVFSSFWLCLVQFPILPFFDKQVVLFVISVCCYQGPWYLCAIVVIKCSH